jgi:trehalose 6-phosphate synthase
VIVVSHRGPVSFQRAADGTFGARRGAGGVVSALAPLLRDRDDATWIAAAIGDEDRAAVAAGAVDVPGLRVQLLALDPETHRRHYDVISNNILWFCFHGLFDSAREPVFDAALHEAWEAYRAVNRSFAEAVAETAAPGEVVLVQDLQLLLVAGFLAELRPDVAVTHFTHTPFGSPSELALLPDAIAGEIFASLTAAPAGFHTEHWVHAFRLCLAERPAHVSSDAFAATFGPDAPSLHEVAAGDAAARAGAHLADRIGDRRSIVRTDRLELSKNIVRGFLAFDELLATRPEWRERVSFVAMLNPSRESLEVYRDYRAAVEQCAADVNERWGHGDWEPIIVDTRDDFPRSVAALQLADVLLVNPVRDGLNLVAMEGPLLNERDAVLCLSREAGAFDLLRDHSVEVHPFDVSQTATALDAALSMDAGERATHASALRETALAHPADRWLDELVRRARPAHRAS